MDGLGQKVKILENIQNTSSSTLHLQITCDEDSTWYLHIYIFFNHAFSKVI